MRHLTRALLALTSLTWAGAADAQQWTGVDQAVQQGIAKRTYPGAVLVVGRSDTVLYEKGYGRTAWSSRSTRPDPETTLWDLASLTKVVATASATMVLVDRGELEIDAPVDRYLPEFAGPGKDRVTLRMLLDHTSGLRPWAPLYRQADRDGALAALFGEPLRREPGGAAQYSDLNAILLGLAVERAAGEPLDELANRAVFGPLGMSATHFRPTPAERSKAAPSRLAGRSPVAGIVNDDNARRLGGVAGHAGLFSTGADLARFAQAWLRSLTRGSNGWVSPEVVRLFSERSPVSGTRALGWDTPDTATTTSFGALAHRNVLGHTGWTGTSLWIDPAQDLFVVLLTNRTISPRGNRSLHDIKLVRAALSDAVRLAAGPSCGTERGVAC
ncbi:MAG TPA: serine hydrolase domain-containing protein [Gemmatimonadales bacterium]|nr:serine hydrolase domain-containing protein [Gemmatimonadales bacterium]